MAITTIARFNWTEKDENGNPIIDDDGKPIVHKNDIRWDEDTGGFAMCSGLDAYAQTIEAVVKTVHGELITKINYGVPWFSTIFNSRVYAEEWAQSVRDIVLALDFVSSIDSFVYEYDRSRKCMTYTMSVTTTDGSNVEVSESEN